MTYTEYDHEFNAHSVRFEPATPPRMDPDHDTRPTLVLGDEAYVTVYRDTGPDGTPRLRISVDVDGTWDGAENLPISLDLPGGTVYAIDSDGRESYGTDADDQARDERRGHVESS
jgi:hypothetical protein